MKTRYWCLWITVALSLFACRSGPAPVDDEADSIDIDDCVSESGQRLLTFCASRDAAVLATRQHGIQRGIEDGKTGHDYLALPVDGAPVRGERDAPITVHLFSDLGCADCRAVYKRLAAEVDHRPGEMRLVFRHAPIDDAGESMARAAVAAGNQGAFWAFVDALYAEDDNVAPERWAQVAEDLGIDVERWEDQRRMPAVSAALEHDAIQGESVGVVSPPTFFVNGQRMVGAVAIHELEEVIEAEREHVAAMEEAGLSGADISWRRILHNYAPVDWRDVDRSRQTMESDLLVEHVPVEESPQIGAAPHNSRVTAVVFADFQCPYSARAAEAWNQLLDQYADKGLRVVFKRFPLSINEGAERVARASVLAQQLEAFWPFHDALFWGDTDAEQASLRRLLEELGGEGLSDDALQADNIAQVVAADQALGLDIGVEGTPTAFVNGIKLVGAFDAQELKPLIEEQLELGREVSQTTRTLGEPLYRELVDANRRR